MRRWSLRPCFAVGVAIVAVFAAACGGPDSAGRPDAGGLDSTLRDSQLPSGHLDAAQRLDASAPDAATPDAREADLGPGPIEYPSDPLEGLQEEPGMPVLYRGRSRFGDGTGQYYVWAPSGYDSAVSWPVVVMLHGGSRTTGTTESLSYAASELRSVVRRAHAENFIWIAPVIRMAGSYHAWAVKQNTIDIVDAIREVRRRFKVDDGRVFLSGTSMGGGGVATISWLLPHTFAAYGPVIGYYWNRLLPAPDLTDVHYRVVAGALDRPPDQPINRVVLAEEFVRLAQTAGASVEFEIEDEVGHWYSWPQIARMNLFFLERAPIAAPNWEAIRAYVDENGFVLSGG